MPTSGEMNNVGRLWWLIAFDALLGCLFLFLFVGDVRQVWFPSPEASRIDRLINLVACLIDVGVAPALLGAGLLLLKRKRAALFQRAAAWFLLMRSGLVLVELLLPGQGGIDGLLRIGVLLVLAVLTAMALAAALFLGRSERQKRVPQAVMEQPGAWPPPPTSPL